MQAAQEDVPAKTVICKLDASLPKWIVIADQSRAIGDEATGIPKAIFNGLHDSMKGSADIVRA